MEALVRPDAETGGEEVVSSSHLHWRPPAWVLRLWPTREESQSESWRCRPRSQHVNRRREWRDRWSRCAPLRLHRALWRLVEADGQAGES